MPTSLIHGDCLLEMSKMDANSITGIVTDPPYGISFMNKHWDHGIPGTEYWAECLRIAKPGAHLLAFGGTRTFHRLTCAIEDAGWEIRDCVSWLYGSGFPKSLNISKSIDKCGGETLWWFGEFIREYRQRSGLSVDGLAEVLRPAFPEVDCLRWFIANWERGIQRPTNDKFNAICKALNLPFSTIKECERSIIGSKMTQGSEGSWKTEKGMFAPGRREIDITCAASDLSKQFDGYGTALKPAWEPIIMAMKPCEGTFAQNAEKHGVAGINIDGCRITVSETDPNHRVPSQGNAGANSIFGCGGHDGNLQPQGRWPANLILDEEAGKMLDEQTSDLGKSKGTIGNRVSTIGIIGFKAPDLGLPCGFGDSGGASRFFYCAKASSSERGKDNKHPTVKPLKLMEYLLKLIAPPKDAIILDPFMGSGTTLLAAQNLGIKAIGIELSAEYCEIARARLIFK